MKSIICAFISQTFSGILPLFLFTLPLFMFTIILEFHCFSRNRKSSGNLRSYFHDVILCPSKYSSSGEMFYAQLDVNAMSFLIFVTKTLSMILSDMTSQCAYVTPSKIHDVSPGPCVITDEIINAPTHP
jgi:hypothetical protein